MKESIKILFTDLRYLNHNYGAQGIAFPLMEKLNNYFKAEYTFALLYGKNYKEDSEFSPKFNFNIIVQPKLRTMLKKGYTEQHISFIKKLNRSDVIIDLSGIEFIGNQTFKTRWGNYINTIYPQLLAKKYKKLYLKYTKSYGPFPHKIYRFFVKKNLNSLPFVFIRGKNNLETVKKLNLKVQIFSFPDVSIALDPESKDWVLNYIKKLKLNSSKQIVGISPSAVIRGIPICNKNSSCNLNHEKLCKKIIRFYQSKGQQVLLIPHSIGDGRDIKSCDLALSKKVYLELENKENVFVIQDMTLTYKQVRSIISLLNFYVTGRYHSVSSALSMGVPIVSLSWHIKYKDIMSLFLEDFLAIDCRTTGIEQSLSLIKKYFEERSWFNKNKVLIKKEKLIKEIDRSIGILAKEIRRDIKNKNGNI